MPESHAMTGLPKGCFWHGLNCKSWLSGVTAGMLWISRDKQLQGRCSRNACAPMELLHMAE